LDEESLEVAKANVEQNGLEDRITLFLNKDPLRIFVLDPSIKTYDFCMCNPPFYASEEEVQEGLENKELEPMAVSNKGS
jgi:23S rRNA A1618 N6-methylase RlmF